MKLGTFIVASLCVASSTQVYAEHRRTHDAAIEQYRKAYEADSDPHLLTLIADEYRQAGKLRDALDYYCAYMYVDAAGDDADMASQHARELAKSLGRSSSSDQAACTKSKPAPAAQSVTGVDALGTTLPAPPARISKGEIVGLSLLGVGIGGLGAALYEGREVARVRGAQRVNDPQVDQDALQAQAESHMSKQKMFLIGGGVTLVAGGLLYVFGRYERLKPDRTTITPIASKNGGGLVLGRAF